MPKMSKIEIGQKHEEDKYLINLVYQNVKMVRNARSACAKILKTSKIKIIQQKI